MTMLRGTRVVLPLGANGAVAGDIGTVYSRKCNGWLRVSIDPPTTDTNHRSRTVVSVRNTKSNVVVYDEYTGTVQDPVIMSFPVVSQTYENPKKAIMEDNPKRSKKGYMLYSTDVMYDVTERLISNLMKGTRLKPKDVVYAIATQWLLETQSIRDEWNAKAKYPEIIIH